MRARPIPQAFGRLLQDPQVRLFRSLREASALVHYRTVERPDGARVVVDGRSVVMLGSNDYLDLRWDPRVIEAARRATAGLGSGAGGSRLMAGNVRLHRQLEEELADWTGREDAVLFTTGYQANLGTLSALLRPGDDVLCDLGVHASLLDGCTLAQARIRRFRRQSMATLQGQLRRSGERAAALVLDAVYSMEGDQGPVDAVAETLVDSPVLMLVDEAHALGVYGREGGGLATTALQGERVDLVTGTLSKSLASCGGFVAGPREVTEAIRVKARSLLFSTASVPGALGAALEALRIARAEEDRRERLHARAAQLREGLAAAGISTGPSDSPIVPAFVGDDALALAAARRLFEADVFAGVAVHPAVPPGRALVRFSVTAGIPASIVNEVTEKTVKVFSELEIL